MCDINSFSLMNSMLLRFWLTGAGTSGPGPHCGLWSSQPPSQEGEPQWGSSDERTACGHWLAISLTTYACWLGLGF